jgi:hypothetical protein
MKKEYTSVSQYALSDIAEDVKQKAYIKGKEIDTKMWSWVISSYFVSTRDLNTKENRRLNKELGVNTLNYIYRYQKNN